VGEGEPGVEGEQWNFDGEAGEHGQEDPCLVFDGHSWCDGREGGDVESPGAGLLGDEVDDIDESGEGHHGAGEGVEEELGGRGDSVC